MRFTALALLACAMLPLASEARSEISAPPDYISTIFLSNASNYASRVFFQNPSTLPASCSAGFAYVNVSADNYQAYVSSLTSAYLAHKLVSLYYIQNGSFCQITEFVVSG